MHNSVLAGAHLIQQPPDCLRLEAHCCRALKHVLETAQGTTYKAALQMDLVIGEEGAPPVRVQQRMGHLPIMVKSRACYLRNLSQRAPRCPAGPVPPHLPVHCHAASSLVRRPLSSKGIFIACKRRHAWRRHQVDGCMQT
jgi:hypothetical protein